MADTPEVPGSEALATVSDEVALVTARLNGCEHPTVKRDYADGVCSWRCYECDQAFVPLLEQPVRPRANNASSRLSGFQDW